MSELHTEAEEILGDATPVVDDFSDSDSDFDVDPVLSVDFSKFGQTEASIRACSYFRESNLSLLPSKGRILICARVFNDNVKGNKQQFKRKVRKLLGLLGCPDVSKLETKIVLLKRIE